MRANRIRMNEEKKSNDLWLKKVESNWFLQRRIFFKTLTVFSKKDGQIIFKQINYLGWNGLKVKHYQNYLICIETNGKSNFNFLFFGTTWKWNTNNLFQNIKTKFFSSLKKFINHIWKKSIFPSHHPLMYSSNFPQTA